MEDLTLLRPRLLTQGSLLNPLLPLPSFEAALMDLSPPSGINKMIFYISWNSKSSKILLRYQFNLYGPYFPCILIGSSHLYFYLILNIFTSILLFFFCFTIYQFQRLVSRKDLILFHKLKFPHPYICLIWAENFRMGYPKSRSVN